MKKFRSKGAKIVKILAHGCNHRYMWIQFEDVTYCVRISDRMYHDLYRCGVPTSQRLRWSKQDKNG